MSNRASSNLDIRCAEIGKEFVSKKNMNKYNINESAINKLLLVLEENGPYAMYLYGCVKLQLNKEKGATNDKQEKVKKESMMCDEGNVGKKKPFCTFMKEIIRLINTDNQEDNFSNRLEGETREEISDASSLNRSGMEKDSSDKKDIIEKKLKALAVNLNQYLFLQDLLRRALIYAKYHAKAIEASEGGQ